MNARWGKKFVNKRDWKEINEEYVVRGEFFLDLNWVCSWDEELKKMNKEKRGAPFEFPESLIQLQAVWGQWVNYRGLEGITRKLHENKLVPKYNDFSTIYRRVIKIDTDFELPLDKNISVATDGSGISMCKGGTYRERKYGKIRRKYIKVTISADPIRKNLLDCEVSIEGEGNSEPDTAINHLENLIKEGFSINKFFGDGSFDKRGLFNLLDKYGIQSCIKIRSSATKERDPYSVSRNKEVKAFLKQGYKKWAKVRKYGIRWNLEGIFSSVKRIFGENIRSSKIKNMMIEIKRRFWVYQRINNYAKA